MRLVLLWLLNAARAPTASQAVHLGVKSPFVIIGCTRLLVARQVLVFVAGRLLRLIGNQVRYICVASARGLHDDHARGQRRHLRLLSCWSPHFRESHVREPLLLRLELAGVEGGHARLTVARWRDKLLAYR